MSFHVLIKSGTSGHSDYDNCDLLIADVKDCSVPNKYDVLKINNNQNYLVTEVVRSLVAVDKRWNECIRVYVIKQ